MEFMGINIGIIVWLVCGLIGYLYFGIKTKWLGRKYNTKFEDSFEIIIASLCGIYTLFVVIKDVRRWVNRNGEKLNKSKNKDKHE